jgi:hypothetical protein
MRIEMLILFIVTSESRPSTPAKLLEFAVSQAEAAADPVSGIRLGGCPGTIGVRS